MSSRTNKARRPAMWMWHTTASAAVITLALVPAARAQNEGAIGTAPETVVTATRIPTPPAQVASTIRVITREQIERNQYRTVGEALQTLPGLVIARSGGVGKTTAIFSRGGNANQTLVMIDGIEFNDPSTTDGRADLSALHTDDVEKIEVLYGSQGTLYGSDAIGAVVNIITKRGKGDPKVAATVEGGSFETANQFASIRGGSKRFDYAFTAQHIYVGGLSASSDRLAPPGRSNDDDRYENYTVTGKFGVAPTENFRVDAVARFTDAKTDTDVNTSVPRTDNDSQAESEQVLLRGDAELKLFDGMTRHRLGVAYSRFDRKDRDDRDPINPNDFLRDNNEGTRLKVDLQNDLKIVKGHTVTVGLETEEETIDASLISISAFGTFRQSTSADARNNAIYLQDQISYYGRFFGTVGVRVDDHEDFGTETTWRIAPAYLHKETGTKVKGSYSTGFKAPTLFQLFGTSASAFGAFRGNPNLLPETSRTWEAGIEQSLWGDRVRAGVTYFDTQVKNLINTNATFTTNINIGKVDLNGIEAFLSVRATDDVTVTLNYSYTAAKNRTTGADLLRRPRNKASLDIGYRPIEGLTLSASAVYIGNRADIDAVSFARVRQNGFVTANLAAAYDITKNFRIFARVENLFDRDYEDPNGFEQPGIGAFGGLTVRF